MAKKRIRLAMAIGLLMVALIAPMGVPMAGIVPGAPILTTKAEAKNLNLTKKQAQRRLEKYLKKKKVKYMLVQIRQKTRIEYVFQKYVETDNPNHMIAWAGDYAVNRFDGHICKLPIGWDF